MLSGFGQLSQLVLLVLGVAVVAYLLGYSLSNPFPFMLVSEFEGESPNMTLEEDSEIVEEERVRSDPSEEEVFEKEGPLEGAEPMSEWGSDEQGAVAGYAGSEVEPALFPVSKLSAEQLLPNDRDSLWAQTHPEITENLKERDFLAGGNFSVGINTQGSSMRNANYQLRSDPPIHHMSVGPWNNPTITDDTSRRPLEIGSC